MEAFRHVLVPTDFSPPAEHALELAIAIAESFQAKLSLLHVFVSPISVYAGYGDGLYWPVEELERDAQRKLEAAAEQVKRRYPNTEGVFASGTAWEGILEVAKRIGADLIVMGTHGRRGLARVLLGSVAEKVLRLSPIPVLTCRGPES